MRSDPEPTTEPMIEQIIEPTIEKLRECMFKRLAELRKEDPFKPIRIIPANNFQSAQLKLHGAMTSANLLNVNFMSFDRLVDLINLDDRIGVDDGTDADDAIDQQRELIRASKADRYLLMSKAIAKSDSRYFGAGLNFSGSNKALQSTVNDLEVSGDLNEKFIGSLKSASSGGINGLSKAKYRDIYAILTVYFEGLKAYRTAGLDAQRAIKVLEGDAADRADLGVPTFFYGFSELTAHQKQVVDLLGKQADVYLCTAEPVDLIFKKEHSDEEGLPALESQPTLIEAPGPQFEVDEVVRAILKEIDGPDDIDSPPTPMSEIAIVYRDDIYRTLLTPALQRAKIPFFIKDGIRSSESIAGRMVASFLNACADKWHRADLAYFLRFYEPKIDAAYFDIATRSAGIYSDLPHLIEIFGSDSSRAEIIMDIKRGYFVSKDIDKGIQRISDAEHTQRFDQIIRTLTELHACTDRFRAAKNFSDMNAAVGDILGAVKDRYINKVVKGNDLDEHDPADVITPLFPDQLDLYEAVMKDISKVRTSGIGQAHDHNDQPRSASQTMRSDSFELGHVDLHSLYRDLVMAELEGSALPIGSFLYTGVNILPYESLRYLSFQTVYFVGMSYKSFPGRQAQDPIILDNEKSILNNVGHALKQSSARVKEEKALFLLALSSASKRIILSYSTYDIALEKALLPSFYILKLAEAVDKAPFDHSSLRERCSFFKIIGTEKILDSENSYLDINDLSMAGLRAGSVPEPLDRSLKGDILHLRREQAYQERTASNGHVRPDGVFSNTSAAKLIKKYIFEDKGEFSPTMLETYAGCPFKAFTERILKLSALEEPENVFETEPMVFGSMIHKILQDFMEECKDDLINFKSGKIAGSDAAPREELISSMTRIAEDVFQQYLSKGKLGNEFIWSYIKPEAMADLVEFVDRELNEPSTLYPKYFEESLSISISDLIDTVGGSKIPFLTDEVFNDLNIDELAKLRLNGISDRIDIDADNSCFLVIDYKTGKALDRSQFKENSVNGGRTIQTPLYFYAALTKIRDDLASPDLSGSGACYYYVTKKGKFKKFMYRHDQESTGFRDFLLAVMISIELMSKGFFPIMPFSANDNERKRKCSYCDTNIICKNFSGQDQFDESDPLMQKLARLREL